MSLRGRKSQKRRGDREREREKKKLAAWKEI
jgi:hypothetical protein